MANRGKTNPRGTHITDQNNSTTIRHKTQQGPRHNRGFTTGNMPPLKVTMPRLGVRDIVQTAISNYSDAKTAFSSPNQCFNFNICRVPVIVGAVVLGLLLLSCCCFWASCIRGCTSCASCLFCCCRPGGGSRSGGQRQRSGSSDDDDGGGAIGMRQQQYTPQQGYGYHPQQQQQQQQQQQRVGQSAAAPLDTAYAPPGYVKESEDEDESRPTYHPHPAPVQHSRTSIVPATWQGYSPVTNDPYRPHHHHDAAAGAVVGRGGIASQDHNLGGNRPYSDQTYRHH